MRPSSRILLLAAAIELAACSSQESTLVKPVEEAQPPAPVVSAPIVSAPIVSAPIVSAPIISNRQQQVSPLRRKVISQLEKKNYRQAIELMNGKNREGLEKEYALAVKGLLAVGNDAYAAGDYATAARSFKGVLNAYPLESSRRDRSSHDPKRIRTLLDVCVNRMMEQGLEEYRRGSLESAIRKWKVLLTIRPGHQEAKKALDTATVQLQALQDMKDM